MLSYTVSEVIGAMHLAPNMNAALKNFLRHEVSKGEPAERLTKRLREAVVGRKEKLLENTLEKHLPDFEVHIFSMLWYAFLEPVNALATEITNEYAERFNASFNRLDDGVQVVSEKDFRDVLLSAGRRMDEVAEELGGIPKAVFRNVVALRIFDADVLPSVYRVWESSRDGLQEK